jgi:putative photosynthetic complex assembly protein
MNIDEKIPDKDRQDKIEGIHKVPLFGALGVAALALFVVAGAQFSGAEKVTRSIGVPEQERTLLFRDGASGKVIVRDAVTKKILATYGRGEGAFIRQSMRAMSHTRIQQKQEMGQPYRLVKTKSGKLSIVDPVTGKFIKLNAFGKVAMDGFLALLGDSAESANATTISEKGA